MRQWRIVCGYCSVDAGELPEYERRHYGNLVAMQKHLMEEHGLTHADFQENMRRKPPAGDGGTHYEWFLKSDNTLAMWSETL